MNRRSCLVTSLFLALFLFPSLAFSQLIRFKDGTEFRGKILKKTDQEVLIQFDFGTMGFKPSEIKSIEEETEPPATPATSPEGAVSAPAPPKPVPSQAPPKPAPSSAPAPPAETTLPQAMRAVAFIRAETQSGEMAVGSGTIINAKGTMLTNYHVIEGAKKITVTLFREDQNTQISERIYEARIVKTSRYYDLAILDIHADTADYLRFAKDSDIRVGEEAKAIGNPLGLQVTISKGIISGSRTNKGMGWQHQPIEGDFMSERAFEDMTWVQTDASINGGNSGGPLLNSKNQIIGINTMGYSFGGGDMGLNFALHVKHLRQFAGGYVGP